VRVLSLNDVWGLEERWKGRVEDSIKSVFNRDLGGWIRLFERYGVSLDIRRELVDAITNLRDEIEIGTVQDGIIYRTYLSFILSNSDELDAIVARVNDATVSRNVE
jgi:hypothetical protein